MITSTYKSPVLRNIPRPNAEWTSYRPFHKKKCYSTGLELNGRTELNAERSNHGMGITSDLTGHCPFTATYASWSRPWVLIKAVLLLWPLRCHRFYSCLPLPHQVCAQYALLSECIRFRGKRRQLLRNRPRPKQLHKRLVA